VAYAPVRSIVTPLTSRGVVLIGADKPIVLCAVDWIGIASGGYDEWRQALADAAGTTIDRVTVHTLHQHDGVRFDPTAEALLESVGHGNEHLDNAPARRAIKEAAAAIRAAVPKAAPVTHIGVGSAKVEKVASSRRILGPDGRVKIARMSATRNPAAQEAEEGVIDPMLRLVSLWDRDRPLVAMTYYATHPQSYYGKGDVHYEFVGMAREWRAAESNCPHVHFNGAGGNVAAGKYNDGSPERRPILAQRLADGMRKAWEATQKQPIKASDVAWRSVPVRLPVSKNLDPTQLRETLKRPAADPRAHLIAAAHLAWLDRSAAGRTIDVSCLRLGSTHVLHMPGELFVEYQLAAQKMRPAENVCMAAYGDYAPGYIGTAIAYTQGGYEVGVNASRVAPEVEPVLMDAMRELLK
jgi:hypothetical protein